MPDRINNRIDQFRTLRNESDILKPDHRRVIADFLIKIHKPLERVAAHSSSPHRVEEPRPICKVTPASPINETPDMNWGREPKAPDSRAMFHSRCCKHCQSTRLEAKSGQYGYYFFCRDCTKNTPIKFACIACDGEGKIRKQGDNFFAECKSCSESNIFHSNSAV